MVELQSIAHDHKNQKEKKVKENKNPQSHMG